MERKTNISRQRMGGTTAKSDRNAPPPSGQGSTAGGTAQKSPSGTKTISQNSARVAMPTKAQRVSQQAYPQLGPASLECHTSTSM